MICYKKNETDCFSYFSKPCWSFGGFSLQSFVPPPPPPPPYLRPFSDFTFEGVIGAKEPAPPYLRPFSVFTFEEVVGAKEPVHWEAPPKGNLNPEVNM